MDDGTYEDKVSCVCMCSSKTNDIEYESSFV